MKGPEQIVFKHVVLPLVNEGFALFSYTSVICFVMFTIRKVGRWFQTNSHVLNYVHALQFVPSPHFPFPGETRHACWDFERYHPFPGETRHVCWDFERYHPF